MNDIDDGARLFELALRQLRQGQIDAAMNTLVQRLSEDPHDADSRSPLLKLPARAAPLQAIALSRRDVRPTNGTPGT